MIGVSFLRRYDATLVHFPDSILHSLSEVENVLAS